MKSPTTAKASEAPGGLWLLPRHDPGNTGRADVSARMRTAPREVWRYGNETGAWRFARRVGEEGYLLQIGRGLEFLDPDGRKRWSHRTLGVGVVVDVLDFNGDDRVEVLVTLGKKGFALLDIATGSILWSWTSPPGTFIVRYQLLKMPAGVRLFVFPPFSTIGICFDFAGTDGTPRRLWQKDYAGKYDSGYGPGLVLADVDNDGRPEIVLASKPAYVAAVDADTGAIKFDLKYAVTDGGDAGRPYGLLQAIDLDGNGYRDIVMISTQVEEYIAVIRNEGGKAFRHVWSQFIEKDFPTDFREIRANTTSLADVNGDGKPELVLGLFNTGGDERWHTVVLDPLVGLSKPLTDLPDRYFRGCYDLDSDGVPEIIASPATGRSVSAVTVLQAVDGRTSRNKSVIEGARLQTVRSDLYTPTRPSSADVMYYAALQTPIYLTDKGRVKGLVVRCAIESSLKVSDPVFCRRVRAGRAEKHVADTATSTKEMEEMLWRIDVGKCVLAPFVSTPFGRLLLESSGGHDLGTVDLQASGPARSPGPAAACPLVSMANGRRELILALSDGTVIGGTPDLGRSGVLRSAWQIRGAMPSVWVGPTGERVVCTVDPGADVIALQEPAPGLNAARPSIRFTLPMPINRNPGFEDSYPRAATWLIPFGKEQMRLFVGFRLNEHALACGLYDSKGTLLWEDVERGPHPRAAAIAELNDDGKSKIVLDNHGMQYIYSEGGARRMIAHCWGDTIPGREDGCAHAQPIVGSFGPGGAMRIFMSPGYSAMELLDGAGARLAHRALVNDYEFPARTAAVGRIRGTDEWDAGLVSETGVFHAVDLNTCQTRWTLDLGVPTFWPISVTAGDLTGAGRDHFLVCLPNGELLALGEQDGRGAILWKMQFPAGLWEAILADVDGDGLAEIVVHSDDGFVRILKGSEG